MSSGKKTLIVRSSSFCCFLLSRRRVDATADADATAAIVLHRFYR